MRPAIIWLPSIPSTRGILSNSSCVRRMQYSSFPVSFSTCTHTNKSSSSDGATPFLCSTFSTLMQFPSTTGISLSSIIEFFMLTSPFWKIATILLLSLRPKCIIQQLLNCINRYNQRCEIFNTFIIHSSNIFYFSFIKYHLLKAIVDFQFSIIRHRKRKIK